MLARIVESKDLAYLDTIDSAGIFNQIFLCSYR